MSKHCMQAEEIEKSFQRVGFTGQNDILWMQLYLPADFGQLEFHIFHFQKENLQCYYVRKVETQMECLDWYPSSPFDRLRVRSDGALLGARPSHPGRRIPWTVVC